MALSSGDNGVEPPADAMPLEKNAGLIMATNSSTTAFKASTERLYHSKPHFYRYFAKEVKRAPPTIHRGYWLRMRAVKWVVRHFLDHPAAQRKVIINLGCGYDPLPFQWLTQKSDLCSNTKFIDVDYELLMETKRDIIMRQPKMRDLLHSNLSTCAGSDPSISIDSEKYAAIGCDLRNLRRLERLLKSVVDLEQTSILCIAEDSTTFMPVNTADALLSWSAGLSSDVTFCLVEPSSPDQPDNPFTRKMTDYYKGLGTPLNSIFKYPYDRAQIQRFSNAGFAHIDYQSLWELWADPRFLSPSQRMKLDHVEPFDDWEEFALWASHYCLVVAHNGDYPVLPGKVVRPRRDSISSDASDISARTSSPCNPDSEHFAFRYYSDPGQLCERHHGSAYPVPDQDAIAIFGGMGSKSYLSTSAVCRPRHLNDEMPIVLSPEVGTRSCHVIIALNNGNNILVGGRRSPTQPLKDCWLQNGNTWYRIHDLPEGRYRHRIVPVTLPGSVFGAICFGGKVSPTKVAIDILLWEPSKGWSVLPTFGSDPKPRFGSNFVCLGFNHGLLFGGMRQDGVICQGFWRWRLVIRDNEVVALRFRPSHALETSIGSYQYFARFGASYGFVQDYLLIIGGIAKGGCIPRTYEILSLTGTFSTWHDESKEPSFRVVTIEAACSQECPRPLLIGHSTRPTLTGAYVILGGGATCWNFGDYFSKGIWVLYEKEAGIQADWIIVPSKASQLLLATSESSNTAVETQPEGVLIDPILTTDPDDFNNAVRQSRPLLMKGLNFGPCTQLWSMSYLKSLLLHKPNVQKMNRGCTFGKNENMAVVQLLDEAGLPTTILDLCKPTLEMTNGNSLCLHRDKAQFAEQFQIPIQLGGIECLTRSTQLYISTNAYTKLHYSAMANILFQVQSARKVLLFPPLDQSKLEFPPGSHTSGLDIFSSKTPSQEQCFYAPPGTSPHIAILTPGDALFVPPFWSMAAITLRNDRKGKKPICDGRSRLSSHATSSDLTRVIRNDTVTDHNPPPDLKEAGPNQGDTVDITVKISFTSLQRSMFTASQNNTSVPELTAYDEGRRDLETIVNRFASSLATHGVMPEAVKSLRSSDTLLDHLPKDVAKAYLQRLGKELLMKADEL